MTWSTWRTLLMIVALVIGATWLQAQTRRSLNTLIFLCTDNNAEGNRLTVQWAASGRTVRYTCADQQWVSFVVDRR